MKKITINDVVFCNFGSNNYSEGMELVSSYPCDPQMIEDVLLGRYSLGEKQVFLNPSAPCGEEFFGVLGTQEQYKELYERQAGAQIAKIQLGYINEYAVAHSLEDVSDDIWRFAEFIAKKQYKDWWNK
jgi:hypothetical protein